MPSQKFGTDRPQSATPLASPSIQVPGRTAERIPIGTPMTRATSIARQASSSVTGSFSRISSITGFCSRIDSPRSPCSTPVAQ